MSSKEDKPWLGSRLIPSHYPPPLTLLNKPGIGQLRLPVNVPSRLQHRQP